MPTSTVLIQPFDPIIFRDARPFTTSVPARTLSFPIPSVIAGALRSRSHPSNIFSKEDAAALRELPVTGPFLATRSLGEAAWRLAFPAPADAVSYESATEAFDLACLRPEMSVNSQTDLPENLHLLKLTGGRSSKIASVSPTFWHSDFYLKWLEEAKPRLGMAAGAIGHLPLPQQKRVHVGIQEETRVADDGFLFSTTGLEFTTLETEYALCAQTTTPKTVNWPVVAPLGGERRLAAWSGADPSKLGWPEAPRRSLAAGSLIRLILCTPGHFQAGWRPDWLVPGRASLVPFVKEKLELELVAAAVPRFQASAGWDLAKNSCKPARFLAPAGSVYWCRLHSGDPYQLWLRSICDLDQDRLDGFGLTFIGESSWHKE
jgi:CRISPR-associated protein Cmr3